MTRTTSSSLDSDTTVVEISQADNETISTKCDIVISETQIPLCSKTTESSTIGTQSILENLSKTNPVRPIKNSYPQRLLGGQLRSFQASWYEKREWLEYVEELDACFSFPCRVFSPSGVDKSFSETGYRNWKAT